MKRGSIEKLIIGIALAAVYWVLTSANIPGVTPSKQPTALTSTPTPPPIAVGTDLHTVTRVIDGDTIEIETGQKVRYIGIDTPELHHPTKGVQCFGEEARAENERLVGGKEITMTKDVSETDRYGRLLRYVFLPPDTASAESTFVNEVLVRDGFAHAVTYQPDVANGERFREAEKSARNNNRGLWKSCTTTP